MAYLVLARKYRPQRFLEVVGQEVIIKTLSQALSSGRIAHAFLLTGSRGVGKTTVARLLAKALCCEQGISSEPCGVCSHCLEIAAGESLDVLEIDGASNTGVDDVRQLRENVRYQPSSACFKVIIIDEVHMLSNNAFNALLKTLEEPPEHVKFIFATTEAHKIPVTILSRCQRYDFKRMPVATIVSQLQTILKQENLEVDTQGLHLIAENADGGMRDALSLLDQVISFSGNQASLEDVVDILGLVDRQAILKATQAILEGQSSEALSVLESVAQAGHDFKQLLDGVALQMRHLCLAASVGSIAGLADLTEEQVRWVDVQAKKYDIFDLQRLFSMGLQAIDQIQGFEKPKLVVELAFLKMAARPQMQQMSEVESAIRRLEGLAGDSKLSVEPRVTEAPVQQTIKPKNTWVGFVEAISQQMPVVGHHLEHARYNGKDQIEFDQKLHFSRVQESAQVSLFQDLCRQYLGGVPKVTLSESIHAAKETAVKREQENIEEKARSHPTIQKALSIFGGEIKAVRKV